MIQRPKKKTHVAEDPVHEALKIIVPEVLKNEAGKQFFNIMSRFTGYHLPIVCKDGGGAVDPIAMAHDEGMRNVYRFFRGYMPVDKLGEIEHGTYPYDIVKDEETN